MGGCNAYLVNSKSNCECCMVFRDLLFVSDISNGFKIDEMREFFLTKITFKLFI